jgi:DNA-binding CsgD family transcriptional regulator
VIVLRLELKTILTLIILPGYSCFQSASQFAAIPYQGTISNCSYIVSCGLDRLASKPNIDTKQLILIRSLPPTLGNSDPYPGKVEQGLINGFMLEDRLSVRSESADYDVKDDKKIHTDTENVSSKAIDSVLALKPLKLLNLLAGEDVTLYEAADILKISVDTANKYVAKIKSEFGVLTLPAAVLYATERGLIKNPIDVFL